LYHQTTIHGLVDALQENKSQLQPEVNRTKGKKKEKRKGKAGLSQPTSKYMT